METFLCVKGTSLTVPFHDVWDLLYNRCIKLDRFLKTLPHDAVLVIIAGSPCTDWSAQRKGEGEEGPTRVAFLARIAMRISEQEPVIIQ